MSDQFCTSDDDCRHTCFKWLLENGVSVPDLRCDTARAQCVGLDAASMVHASAHLLFWPLLQQRRVDAPPRLEAAFTNDIERLLLGTSDTRRALRWSPTTIVAHLRHMQVAYDAKSQYASTFRATQHSVELVAQQFWQSSNQRCQSRYC